MEEGTKSCPYPNYKEFSWTIITLKLHLRNILHKLSTDQLLEVYKKAIKSNVSKDFIILISEELNKRCITEHSKELIIYQ